MKKSSADNQNGDLPPRHHWVQEVFERSGVLLNRAEDGVYACALSGDLARFLGRDAVRVTFHRKAAMAGRAELAVPGSWLHDQLLRFARERGRVTRAFLPVRPGLDRAQVAAARRREGVSLDRLVEKRHGTVLVFTFRVFYYSDPAEEDVFHVGFDCERRRVVRRSLARWVSEATVEPATEEYAPAPRPDVAAAFGAAWNVVQDEVEAHTRVLVEAGRPAYEDRIRTVGNYYRQLLAEEKRLLESRLSRKGQDESRGRIDLLKVEWERRMKEEADRLRPQVVARLSAAAALEMPLERWRTVRGNGHGGEEYMWIDLARGEAWEEPPRGGPEPLREGDR